MLSVLFVSAYERVFFIVTKERNSIVWGRFWKILWIIQWYWANSQPQAIEIIVN